MTRSGGGVFLIPLLTLLLGIPIKEAIGASIVAVITTSTASAIAYVGDELTNIRLGMTLELATTVGAVLGGVTAAFLGKNVLAGLFAAAMLPTIVSLWRKKDDSQGEGVEQVAGPSGPLDATFYDPKIRREVSYRVRRLPLGMCVSFIAGNISGLLGIGGGAIKVPAMTLGMGVPMKAAAATSNFMIGVTAVASAYIYYSRGDVNPLVAVPTAIGVTAGALAGSRIGPKLRNQQLNGMAQIKFIGVDVRYPVWYSEFELHNDQK
ncbi:MAG TPA: sulfite exporter TauE/SafE family protein [Symbiobacteriaceae bacterium]|nr:sulfite exporter TauE/SafE family protein [Symbiobacteriaceae bacterium]